MAKKIKEDAGVTTPKRIIGAQVDGVLPDDINPNEIPHTIREGDTVQYPLGEYVVESTVSSVGATTILFEDGNWCHAWQAGEPGEDL